MGEFQRDVDGRRIFTVEFKREVVQQILKGEKTLAELSREHNVTPLSIGKWMRRYESGAAAGVKAGEDLVPASEL